MNSERKSNRSGNKLCAVCESSAPLVEHHINGRDFKDANKLWNRCWVCATCHDRIHRGDLILEGWFLSTAGRIMVWHKKGEPSVTGVDVVTPLYGKKAKKKKSKSVLESWRRIKGFPDT